MLRGLFEGAQYNSEAGATRAVNSRARAKIGHGEICGLCKLSPVNVGHKVDFGSSLAVWLQGLRHHVRTLENEEEVEAEEEVEEEKEEKT